ncbi:hypothetical protein GCM10010965_27570 [Caldalkalibacillus thermarum]|nr:hypothetical protein [Caldalkalibacillus thermarum]GGK33197.1 hypothetical protein GCM10010965_27570 [Caldalkalibacillus thermarum]
MFWVGLAVGLFVGGIAGAFVLSCCCVAKMADEKMIRERGG